MNTTQRATARTHRRARREVELLDALENHVASTPVTGLVDTLRGYEFSDAYIAASLLAGAKTLIRGMPNKQPWTAYLEQMAKDIGATNG